MLVRHDDDHVLWSDFHALPLCIDTACACGRRWRRLSRRGRRLVSVACRSGTPLVAPAPWGQAPRALPA
ncbi:hypothetical protein AZ22_4320 [Bordetella bronchiseptica 980-2]|uniref:Uncharacterized protein n=1 Tax=Bordetella bronchiseptica 00-P-2796 TaxID=1331199 RepID=A0ABR4RI84_BORBO|nr:hypothetical protein AZ22_4320 [Bordetella bronchiseptica 980-2]KCV36815.1 hypothetical protein L490_4137 [Bordetella bronchiseptica 00-P-2796]KCV48342.1 hypothetical protein L491_4427 [Bordetella bronchiseptica 3E44]KCV57284.1 hypothetical protein AZ14_4491 [Bordetella bronchiseptica 980]KDB57894.1 hypothetical protein AZ16_4358 [Bordetella bronchiseptica B18-5 (C3)]KDB72496.1 hypothetical protein AZ21_4487 [Bordetella bronchiseptica B20-10725633]KDB76700.1 hypothetical protein L495_4389 